ncbi:hypothetical protein BH09MYX1_BH09MYX1_31030 [soil metagenome]
MKHAVRLLAVVASLAFARSASADDVPKTPVAADTRAEQLFNEATALAEKGAFADACPKFEEAQKLDPGLGTQFNLALCYESLGKLGSAWKNFRAVEKIAHATGKKGREDAAHQKVESLRPRVGHLVVDTVDADAIVKVDGDVIDRDSLGFWAVDPGAHTIDVTAGAKKPWHADVDVATTPGAEVKVSVPKLVVAQETITREITKEKTDPKRVAGFIAGGIGIVGVATAVVTGIIVLGDASTAKADCTAPSPGDPSKLACRTDAGRDAVNQGTTVNVVNAIAWGVGGAGLVKGKVLILISLGKKDTTNVETKQTTFMPWMGPSGGGVALSGRF